MTTVSFPAPSRTFLTRKGYVIEKDGNDDLVQHLRDFLTVTPVINPTMPNASNVVSFPVFRESTTHIYIPKAFGLKIFGEPSVQLMTEGELAPRLQFQGKLREEQKAPVEAFLKSAANPTRRGGLLILPCAFGKTALSLYLAATLGRKTLVICHKEFLINQWKERIETFLPNARVGVIKQSIVDVQDKDIVIGSLQSIAMRNYSKETFQDFGFTIYDECHHLSAEVFSRCLPKTTTHVMLGLSATPNRKDGLRKVFEWFIGKPVYEVRKRTETSLIVWSRRFIHNDPDQQYGREIQMWAGRLNFAKMINAICNYTPRNEYIVQLLQEVFAKEPDRHVLIMSERKTQLKQLETLLRQHNVGGGSIGYYVGGMKHADMEASTKKQILLATVQICSEGFDVPTLNTLVLASPISSIEQPIGRVQRQKPEERKYVPMVIDVWDQYSIFQQQGLRRLKFYKKNGYKIHMGTNQEDDELTNMENTDTETDVEDTCESKAKQKVYDFVDDE